MAWPDVTDQLPTHEGGTFRTQDVLGMLIRELRKLDMVSRSYELTNGVAEISNDFFQQLSRVSVLLAIYLTSEQQLDRRYSK